MTKLFVGAVFGSFMLGVCILFNELFHASAILHLLARNESFLPGGTYTFELAKSEKYFNESQVKAYNRRVNTILPDILKHLLVLCSTMMLLNRKARKTIQVTVSSLIKIFPMISDSSRTKETAFVSLVVTAILMSVFSTHPVLFKPAKGESMLVTAVFTYLMLAFVIIPFIYFVVSKLFKVYSGRLISACYLAYYVKSISEFMTVEDVNFSQMKKLDVSVFSKPVVDYLKERKLDNRVYSEIKKSDTLNAALVGWGALERIEIYGDHKDLTDREFESILMHEIGHSQDYSLFKKLAVLFTVKFLEMYVVFYLFNTVSEKYADEFLSKYAAFTILIVIYFIYMDRWLIFFHKLMSQTAENAADLIAKAHGYGEELAKVLFGITVKGDTVIRSTWFYNAIRSYHPTVYNRIERLTQN